MPPAPRVALVTLGCARNEVDSEELAGRLAAAGWTVVDRSEDADAVLVNTCGFVESAKRESVDTLLALADSAAEGGAGRGPAVVAVGCLAERYGEQLAESLPEADAVLGFDDYPDIAERLRAVVAGQSHVPHAPRDRRLLLPVTPVERAQAAAPVPGHSATRLRLAGGPVAAVKLASGCDRRCSFCAIPSFRGAYVSRRPADVLTEVRDLAGAGVREVVLVSENSTSYGKDLGDLRLLESLLPELAAVPGLSRVRVSYLQPAEMRPGLVRAIGGTPGVAAYFDLSFQHASPDVLRRMRRFGGTEPFLQLLADIRSVAPEAGVRSNVIVGFPGESDAELAELVDFLGRARLDAVGVFGYSDEDGTEAAGLAGKVPEDEIRRRVDHVAELVDELASQRAEDRLGTVVEVLVEERADAAGTDEPPEGRAAHQGPEDGRTVLVGGDRDVAVGEMVTAVVEASDGVDLRARIVDRR
jgi:ribosomal protein S12 methylthiotransferase